MPHPMRQISIATVVLLFGLLALCACASATPSYVLGDDADVAITRSEVRVVVHGMSCPLCATNVDRAIADVPGVDKVAVDMETGDVLVSLTGSPSVTPRALAAAVASTGFTLQTIDAR